MTTYRLRLCEDRVSAGAEYLTIPAEVNCVLYVVSGEIMIQRDAAASTAEKEKAVFAGGPCKVQAVANDSRVLRFELLKEPEGAEATIDASAVDESRLLLENEISLDQNADYLIRCDRVDFDLGSEALPHGHRGGGIRWLAAGELKVKQGDGKFHPMQVGDPWFEDGKIPVHAVASTEVLTAFIRVSIQPREIMGKSSIMYVNPEDAKRSKPRTYTVFVDEPIEI
jgi:hypothetical protein